MVVEVVGGLLASSLALLSDAAHMLTDAGAIGLALVAARLAARPASGRFTFGFGRAEILSAQVNGATLLVLAGVIAVEAIQRLFEPPDVDGAFVVVGRPRRRGGQRRRGVGARARRAAQPQRRGRAPARAHRPLRLARGRRGRRGRARHRLRPRRRHRGAVRLRAHAALGLGPAARLRAACCSRPRRRAWTRRRSAGRWRAEPGVVEVHDLHIWEVTSGFPALAAHVLVRPGDDCHGDAPAAAARCSTSASRIDHVTLQVDHAAAAGSCSRSSATRRSARTLRAEVDELEAELAALGAAHAHRVARLTGGARSGCPG